MEGHVPMLQQQCLLFNLVRSTPLHHTDHGISTTYICSKMYRERKVGGVEESVCPLQL
jgi:hypothetical protein